MSDAEWDDDNFEAPVTKPVISDKWEGEDEDEEVRENWDDEDEQEKKEATPSAEASAVQIKKKKPLKERLAEKAEKEEKRKKELEEKRKQDEEMRKQFTPKQLHEDKLRRQKLQEAADLQLAVEAFGFAKEEPAVVGVIDGFDPKTKEDFDKFSQMLCEKITKFDKSPYYVPFLENLVRDLTLGVGAEDLKKISSTLTALYNEKVKLQKGIKGKKKTKKATLVVEKDGVTLDADARFENDFEDYL